MCNDPRFCEKGSITAHTQVGPGLYLLRAHAPQTARTYRAGQFVHVQIPRMDARILRRPFSVYRVFPETDEIEILYQVVGAGTAHMVSLQIGETIDILGVMGHSWFDVVAHAPHFTGSVRDAERICVVAGGLGAAPLFGLVEELIPNGTIAHIILGGQTQDHLVTEESYRVLAHAHETQIHITTDDGSCGMQGFVTVPLEEILRDEGCDLVVCCGPEPAMRAVHNLCARYECALLVSLEKRMACGIGACLSCVVKTDEGLRRSCVDGPVFDASKVVW